MSYRSEAVQKTRRKNANIVRKIKDMAVCPDCKIAYPWYVMEFDHVRGEKKFNLSIVTRTNVSMKRILEEISKCDIVCSNCHSIRTHNRRMESTRIGEEPVC